MGKLDPRLDNIFAQAMEIADANERAAFVEHTCGGDDALRREVEALLQADQGAGDFMKATQTVGLANAIPSEQAGERIGRYKLLEQIGEGGFGVVWMAEQEEPVRRRVALKIIKLGMDTRQVVARFEAERQALAMMEHPNIAKVFDGGATDTGRPYFVMELVRGVRITDYCDANKLSTRDRLALFIQVCQAVQHAHQKGIIHRDLKPSNILVTEQDGKPMPKVIDFGVAKATQARLTERTLFTGLHQMIGTPAYMSPEQAGLGALDVDTRSDIYALGVLLYELLTGRPPFTKEEFEKAGLDEIFRLIREQDPPKPSTRLSMLTREELTTISTRRQSESAKLNKLLRGDLDWVVMKAMEKDRSRRYETANGLALDIQRHLKSEPVAACPPGNLYRIRKLVRRHRLAFAAASAVTASLIIGLGISTWSFINEREARQRAVAAEQSQARFRREAETEASKSRQVAQFLKDMLSGVAPEVALGRDTTLLREILDQTAERVGKDLQAQPEVEAELRSTIGQVYGALEQYEKAEGMHRQALTMRKKLFGGEHPDVADSLSSLAMTFSRLGRHAEAETTHREVLAMRRKLLGNEHPDVATSLNGVGIALSAQGKLAEAEIVERDALAMRRKLLGNEHLEVASLLDDLVRVLLGQSKFVEAETLQREALSIQKKLLGQEHPDVAVSLITLAWVLQAEGRLAEAETLTREALAMQRKLLGSDHRRVAGTLNELAGLLRAQGKQAEVETMYREELAARRELLGNEHPSVTFLLEELAGALRDQGKLSEAEPMIREAIAVYEQLVRQDPKQSNYRQHLGHSQWLLGSILSVDGRRGPAEQVLRAAVQVFEQAAQNFPEELYFRQEQAFSHRLLGDLLGELGKVDETERHYRSAVSLYGELKARAPDNTFYRQEEGYTSWMLATKLDHANQFDKADAEYRNATALHEQALADFPSEKILTSRLDTIRAERAAMFKRHGKRDDP